ncbi:amino acid permease [Fodinicola acaciae]|uniref:amino acid permease n=1 Tax=Fodinicola acaciae TaxID=2681555 RepID=UPI0013D25CD6|nr:amino acid permease [Fodinicola acaciae]
MVATTQEQSASPLRQGLQTRQLTMIALGGVIGAGLFVGSGTAIKTAGPGVLLVYLVTGGLVILVMRMLAELAVAAPATGSFAVYATRELGHWAGLAVGWLYAYHWCVTIAFEAIAGAAITQQLLPGIPSWAAALLFMAALTGVNLAQVRSFGRFEFWFALIKVAAIVAFILIGLVAIVGLLPGVPAPGLSNLTGHGGFLPNGWSPLLLTTLVVFFSYFGTELATVAAGEAVHPAETVRRSMRSVAWRILLFYAGSIFVVVMLLPWNATAVTASPYAAVLERLGIPGAAFIMDLIVLTAVLSCLNSGIYSSSRMLFAMARQGEGSKALARTSRSGVPYVAVCAASVGGFLAVLANYFLPTAVVFNFLLNSSGSVAVVIYLVIAVTQIRGRRRAEAAGESLTVRMWGFPYLSWFVVAALTIVLLGMAVAPDKRDKLLLTCAVTAVAVAAGLIVQARRKGAK